MPSSWAIDTALVAKLVSDPQLTALAPDGVWRNVAPQGATRFVEYELISSLDTGMFSGRAFETLTYRVMYVEKSASTDHAIAAANRIDALLDWQILNVTGYGPITTKRIERVGYPEVDDTNARWQHFGGLYEA